VPQAWSSATPAITRAVPVLASTSVSAPTLAPSAGMPGGPFGQALMGALSGRGLSSLAAKAPKVVPRSPAGG
jgi:PPE-SVP subfamily C-terminal region